MCVVIVWFYENIIILEHKIDQSTIFIAWTSREINTHYVTSITKL